MPNLFVSFDVEALEDLWEKQNRSYFGLAALVRPGRQRFAYSY